MSDTLVAYFTASGAGVTKKVAERLAEATGADLYEIEPQEKYTSADIDWTNKQSRSSRENADLSARPALKGRVDNFGQYSRVFVGFPVWWYREPRIIDSFMESEDFSGKRVIPFATSGVSPIGNSGKNMQALAPKADVAEGKRFPADVSVDELKSWAEQF
ncbi:MAG: flavodoxin [Candidatus Weimeria sp.]